MSLPYTISDVIRGCYETPLDEIDCILPERIFRAEYRDWDWWIVPKLKDLCIKVLVASFIPQQPLNLVMQQDRTQLVENLPMNIPSIFSEIFVPEEIHWERRCKHEWPQTVFIAGIGESFWKATYFKRSFEEYVETILPENFDENVTIMFAKKVMPYITELNITQLQVTQTPPTPEFDIEAIDTEDMFPNLEIPSDHIPLKVVIMYLTKITKLRIVFGVNDVGHKYEDRMFRFSTSDCTSLCDGLTGLKNLKILCINKSKITKPIIQILLQKILEMKALEELDLSHCSIEDEGVCALAECLKIHGNLKVVRLTDNKFGEDGMKALGYCIQSNPKAILDVLDLKLNAISERSAKYLSAGLIRCNDKPKELNLSCCSLKGSSALLIAKMLSLNTSLQKLDLRGNDFSGIAEETLIINITINKYLLEIAMKYSGISEVGMSKIGELLKRNKALVGTAIEPLPLKILYLKEPEYLVWEYNPNNPKYLHGFYPKRKQIK